MAKRKSKSASRANVRAASRRAPSVVASSEAALFYSGGSRGFRLADNSTMPTGMNVYSSDHLLNTNADGDVAIGFLPNLNYNEMRCTVTAGNLASAWTQTAHPSLTTLTGVTTRGRQNAMRITIDYVGAAQEAKGVVYFGPSNNFNASCVSAGLSNFTPNMRCVPLHAGQRLVHYCPMLGTPDFESIAVGLTGTAATAFMNYWSGMVYFFRGLPESKAGVVKIRVERILEYQVEKMLTTVVEPKVEPLDPVLEREAEYLSGIAGDQADAEGPGWYEKVGDALWKVFRGTTRAAVAEGREYLAAHQERRFQRLEF